MDGGRTLLPGGRKFHSGNDYAAADGTHIPAAAAGKVVYSGYNASGYGNTIIIESTNSNDRKYYTLYAHMNGNEMAPKGTLVAPGSVIGQVGNTGTGTGAHLHFEVLKGSAPINKTNGGPIGIMSGNEPMRYDPNSFANWGGSGVHQGPVWNAPGSGPADVANPLDDIIDAQYVTVGPTFRIEDTRLSNGDNSFFISGTGAVVTAYFDMIFMDYGATATINGQVNEIYLAEGGEITTNGDDNVLVIDESSVVRVNGSRNTLDLWGNYETLWMNGSWHPYFPHDSIYDSAENILNGLYSLIFNGDTKGETRSPFWPEGAKSNINDLIFQGLAQERQQIAMPNDASCSSTPEVILVGTRVDGESWHSLLAN